MPFMIAIRCESGTQCHERICDPTKWPPTSARTETTVQKEAQLLVHIAVAHSAAQQSLARFPFLHFTMQGMPKRGTRMIAAMARPGVVMSFWYFHWSGTTESAPVAASCMGAGSAAACLPCKSVVASITEGILTSVAGTHLPS